MAAAKGKSVGGTQRILQKLNKTIEDGEYYEAHQLIRTLYFRFVYLNVFVSLLGEIKCKFIDGFSGANM